MQSSHIAAISRSTPTCSDQELEVLLERYRLCISEAQDFRSQLHNLTNFVFVAIGAMAAYVQFKPDHLAFVLLFAPIPLMILHLGHITESYDYLANIELIDRLDERIANLVKLNENPQNVGGESKTLLQIRGETRFVRRTRDTYRNLLHLAPSIGALVWWRMIRADTDVASNFELFMFIANCGLIAFSLLSWFHLKRTFDQSWGAMPWKVRHGRESAS